ncbi:hypothetical protein [Xenorhabdus cabanillasii]|uniref:Bacteriophage protein n=1 Tax=Xenorhabdus cabanillasii JM26 TaxID=1427517 RepID=W1IRU2_9GAMM|nr:hypothetical protein [Xenorhabdus cabanillasii]PHM76961.1 putative bacteriophage protein [Xenorhabdus cabanillasii JM26]CDL79915.1 conserved hypothetical protein [Xenorhabdus cabanillasii JM26]
MSNTNADVIKEFLISLGFDIDKAGEKKFSAVIAGVTVNALKLGAAVEGAALAVVGFTAHVASGLDKLYWQAQRTGGAVEQIKSLGYAVSQAGGTVEGLNSSLENVARFLRNNPGGEGFLRNMGIQTRDTNGQLRDTASLVALVGERLAGMPSYRANMYANMLGIDENTMLAMRRGMGGYASDYRYVIKQLGYDPAIAAKHANNFMTQFSRLKMVTGEAKNKIGGELARVLTPSIEKFTKVILDNWPTIEKVIMSVVKAILTMSEILGQLVFRGAQGIQDLIGWWQQLDKGSQELIKMFGLVAAAWWALNTKFLTSPIGIITTLLAALFLLYDDYQGWKEGKNSFVDWSKWEGPLKQLGEGLKQIKDWVLQIKDAVGGWENVFWGFAIFLGTKWLKKVLGVLGVFSAAASKVKLPEMGKFGGPMGGALNLVAQAEQGREQLMQEVQQEAEKTGEDPVKVLDRKLKEKRANEKPFLTWDDITGWFMGSAKASSSNTNVRGIRNNNPLNMDYAGQKGAVLENHATPRFAKFATAYEGLAKTAWQLRRYFNGKTTGKLLQTIEDIISTWAPAGGKDKNNTEAYIQRVSKMMGVGRRDYLDLNNHDIMYALMNAMGIVESKVFPYSKQLVMSAIAGKPDSTKSLTKNSVLNFDPRMFDNAEANINNMMTSSSYTPEYLRKAESLAQNQMSFEQNLTINITGVQSPHEVAALTEGAVQRSNAILARNLQTKVS